jgi:uncharacterized protein (TIGR00369 family)
VIGEKDPTKYIQAFTSKDRMGSLFGHKILSLSDKECISEYTVSPNHFNPNGILHGGALYTVMDSAQGAFIHFILDPEKFKWAATGTATVIYKAPVSQGKVRVRTYLKEMQNRKVFINSEAHDENGNLLATLEEIWIAAIR